MPPDHRWAATQVPRRSGHPLLRFCGGLVGGCVGRLLAGWQADYQAFCDPDLSDRDYVYCWANGVHFRVRLEQARLCCLVIVGVRTDGAKELVAVADGERESTKSLSGAASGSPSQDVTERLANNSPLTGYPITWYVRHIGEDRIGR